MVGARKRPAGIPRNSPRVGLLVGVNWSNFPLVEAAAEAGESLPGIIACHHAHGWGKVNIMKVKVRIPNRNGVRTILGGFCQGRSWIHRGQAMRSDKVIDIANNFIR